MIFLPVDHLAVEWFSKDVLPSGVDIIELFLMNKWNLEYRLFHVAFVDQREVLSRSRIEDKNRIDFNTSAGRRAVVAGVIGLLATQVLLPQCPRCLVVIASENNSSASVDTAYTKNWPTTLGAFDKAVFEPPADRGSCKLDNDADHN